MGKFNLLDEPWISVVIDTKGKTKEVSLKELFRNAHTYLDLAGDTKTQDFAVMRILLAVIHTVFSRFNAQGEEYGYFDLDERLRQVEKIDEEDVNDYREDLYMTWFALWKSQKFPEIVCEYLEKWRDRFYLFDEEHPFMQVRKEDIVTAIDIEKCKKKNNGTGITKGRTINRLISESKNENTLAIFSPKSECDKDKLKRAEFARWLITYQQYSESGEKNIYKKGDTSCGWLMNIGGYFIKSDNLFKTLLFNCMLVHQNEQYIGKVQRPCWEMEIKDIINLYKSYEFYKIDNLANLYTSWSRAIYNEIKYEEFESKDLFLWCVKLQGFSKDVNFLEPMTAWMEQKKFDIPVLHEINKSMWRSFGLITLGVDDKKKKYRRPIIIDWIVKLEEIMRETNQKLKITICAIGVNYKKDASKLITDIIYDSINMDEYVLADLKENGWVEKINEIIDITKDVMEKFKEYIEKVIEIRTSKKKKEFKNTDKFKITEKVEDLYFKIDAPFRKWIAEIRYEDEKEIKTKEWWSVLYKLTTWEAQSILQSGSLRDYTGIEREGKIKNIATAYNTFVYFLNKEIGVEEVTSGDKE